MTGPNKRTDSERAEQLRMLDGLPASQQPATEEWSHLSVERQRLNQVDRRIADRLDDVPVPGDLRERLLKRAAEESAASETDEKLAEPAAAVGPSHRALEKATGRRDRTSRRNALRWVTVAGASFVLLAAASVGIGMLLWPQEDPPVSRQSVCHDAMKWVREIVPTMWQPDPTGHLGDYPLGPDVLPQPQRWMRIATDYDDQAIVYDLTPPGQKRVLQFTLRSSREFDLAEFLPVTPIYRTGQFCIGACYRDGVLYVLFVEGNDERYRQMIEKRLGVV